MSIESQLRDALTSHAGSIEPMETHAYERVAGAVARNRTRRRTVGVAAVAAVAAIAIGVPGLTSRFGDTRSTPAGTSVVPPATDPAWRSVATWPTRGALAGDADLIATVDAKFSGHTLFLEDMGDDRVAIVANDAGSLILATGPRRAVHDLAPTTEAPTTDYADDVLSVAAGERLVILTTPDHVTAEISGVATIGLDGTVTRTWRNLALTDGVGRAPNTPTTRFRVGGYAGAAMWGFGDLDEPATESTVCVDQCAQLDQLRAQAETTTEAAAQLLQLNPDLITSSTVLSASVSHDFFAPGLKEASPQDAVTLQIVHTRLPGGQILRSGWVRTMGPQSEGGEQKELREIQRLRPIDARTAPIHPLVIAGAGKENDAPTKVYVASPGGAAVRLVSDDRASFPLSPTAELRDGFAQFTVEVTPDDFTSHYSVEVLGAAGKVVGTFPVAPPAKDPYEVRP